MAGLVSSLPSVVLGTARGLTVGVLTASGSVDPTVLALVNGGGSLLSSVVSVVSQAYILGGVVQFCLRVARGEKPEFGVVFSGGRYFASMVGASLLYTFGVVFGVMACIIPGLILCVGWIVYSAFVVDKGLGSVDALKASWQATKPYRINIFVFLLLSFLVGLAGVLACCVGALLVSYPVLMIGNAYLYLKLTGEQPRLPNTG